STAPTCSSPTANCTTRSCKSSPTRWEPDAMPSFRTLEWVGGIDGFLRLLDQTLLPAEVVYRDCRTVKEVCEAIRALRVRGAPAIGVAAAFGLMLHLQRDGSSEASFHLGSKLLASTRPTAVNLRWALERMRRRFEAVGPGAADLRHQLLDEA